MAIYFKNKKITNVTTNRNVINGVIPEGDIELTENGKYNVANYENAIVNVAGSGGEGVEITTNSKAAVDPATLYNEVCFNTDLSMEEVNTILSQVTLSDGIAYACYAVGTEDETKGTYIALFGTAEAGFFISLTTSDGDSETQMILCITTSAIANVFELTETFVGWNPEFNGTIEIPSDYNMAISEDVGTENELITDLFFVNNGSGGSKILQGTYDGSEVKVNTTNINVESMLDEQKLPLTIKVVDDNLVSENIVKDVTILGVTGTHEGGGSGEGITIPKVSNLSVNENGLMTWNAPNLSSVEGFEPVITYVITINSNVVAEVKTTSYDAKFDIVSGENVFGVIVKVSLTNDTDTSKTISYESELSSVSVLTATLEDKFNNMAAACVGDYIYIFGGYNGTTKTRVNTIRQFDCLTETITTLETTLPTILTNAAPYVYENKIHLVGGYTTTSSYTGHVIFDPSTLEVTTGYAVGVYNQFRDTTCIVVGQYLYTLGGYAYVNNTYGNVSSMGCLFATNGNTYTGFNQTAFTEKFANAKAGYYNGEIYVISNVLISKRNLASNTTTLIGINEAKTTFYAGGQIVNKIYLTAAENYSTNIYEFDMETETMRKISKIISIGRTRCASAIYNNTLYLFGGYNYANNKETYLNLIEKITL